MPARPRTIRSLCGLEDIHVDDVAPLARLTALTSLTLLAARRPLAPAYHGVPPFAPLASLPALRRALLGCAGSGSASGAVAWASAGGWVGQHAGCGTVTAYLCPAAWTELASFKVSWLARLTLCSSVFCNCARGALQRSLTRVRWPRTPS